MRTYVFVVFFISTTLWFLAKGINNFAKKKRGYRWWYRKMYMKSPTWKFTRKVIRFLRGSRCREKGTHGGALQVHHKRYSNAILWWGFLMPWNFEVLCENHHRKRHK